MQRVTVVVVRKHSTSDKKPTEIYSQGIIRLTDNNRTSAISCVREGQRQPRRIQMGLKQWTQAPTDELALLLRAMYKPDTVGNSYRRQTRGTVDTGIEVRFPASARYFLTCIPSEDSSGQRIDMDLGKSFRLKDDQFFWPWIGLYNSHLFHAWWLMVGDAFHVLQWQYKRVQMPDSWLRDEPLRQETEAAARDLLGGDTLRACKITNNRRVNYDFHGTGAPIIERLDHLLLEAYRLPSDPLAGPDVCDPQWKRARAVQRSIVRKPGSSCASDRRRPGLLEVNVPILHDFTPARQPFLGYLHFAPRSTQHLGRLLSVGPLYAFPVSNHRLQKRRYQQ